MVQRLAEHTGNDRQARRTLKMSRTVTSALIGWLLVGLVLAVAPAPLEAAESSCIVTGYAPTTDGIYIYSDARNDCTNRIENAVKVRASVQEKVFSVWTVRTNTYDYGNQDVLEVESQYYCNGHGTDVYKTRATGWDSTEETKTRYSSEVSRTC